MLIYLIVFFIVTLLCVAIGKMDETKKKEKYIISIVIILILSVLGGLRTTDIGTDLDVYGARWFKYSHSYDGFLGYVKAFPAGEYGYLLLNYVVGFFTENLNVFLFIHQLICVSLVYVTLYRYREKVPLWLSMLTFLSLYYCRTYNYLRQCIALSIIFWGFKYVEQKKLVKYMIVVFLAAQFHVTAYIGICIYIIYALLTSKIKRKNLIMGIIITGTILVSTNVMNIMKMLNNLNILSDRIYYNYTVKYVNDEMEFSLIETTLKTMFIGIYLLDFKKINKKEKMNNALGMLLIMDIILFQIRNKISYADRITLYFGYPTMLLLPQIPSSYEKEVNKKMMNGILVVLLIAFWIFKFVFENSGEVYPYTSIIFK